MGPEEQLRRAYVAPDRGQTLTINGIAVARKEVGSDPYVTVRYVFQSPANPDVRVLLIDNFSGFADRATENPDIVDLMPAVVATFEFAK